MKVKKRKKNARKRMWLKWCKNCGKLDSIGHFAPPSLGEPGYWICQENCEIEKT